MNVSAILNYEKDPAEDFYAILGCDSSSTSEQVLSEVKPRARGHHPDKCAEEEVERQQEKFKRLLEVLNLMALRDNPF